MCTIDISISTCDFLAYSIPSVVTFRNMLNISNMFCSLFIAIPNRGVVTSGHDDLTKSCDIRSGVIIDLCLKTQI